MQTIKIIHEDGICRVPIDRHPDKFATLSDEDLDELIRLDVDLQWRLVNGNVCTRSDGKNVSIARLICDTGAKEVVLFVDKDHLNLLRENMVIAPGSAKFKARDQIEPTYKFSSGPRLSVEHDVR